MAASDAMQLFQPALALFDPPPVGVTIMGVDPPLELHGCHEATMIAPPITQELTRTTIFQPTRRLYNCDRSRPNLRTRTYAGSNVER
jgi:hypothetical protein